MARDGTAKQRRGVGMDLLLILTGQANSSHTHTGTSIPHGLVELEMRHTHCIAKRKSLEHFTKVRITLHLCDIFAMRGKKNRKKKKTVSLLPLADTLATSSTE